MGVVLAAAGYPGSYPKGDVISLPSLSEESDSAKVFHAGTAEKDGAIVTNGGRVLCATALGNSVTEAQANAYALVEKVSWQGMFYRKDIGYRAIAREND
jgi:phosphoribosylamine--glycine ligase